MLLAQVEDEELLLDAEESEHYEYNIDELMKICHDDFIENDASAAAIHASEIVNASITEGTRMGHERRAQPSFR